MTIYIYPPTVVAPAAGAATSANQVLEIADLDAIKASIASVDTKLTSQATAVNQASQITQETAINTALATLNAKDFATQTTLALIKAKTDNLDVLLSTRTKPSDTQPVSITTMPTTPVTGTFWQSTQPVSIASMPTTAVTGPLTDTQLRATAVPVSGTMTANIGTTNGLALDSSLTTLNAKDFATQTTLALIKAKTDNLDVLLSTRTKPSDTQPVSIASTVSVVETSIAAGTITSIQKSVGITAVRATVSGSAPSARKKLLIKPSKNNTGAIYLGSSSVTTANGLELIGPDRMEFLNENNDYYLISDTASQVVEILEVY